MLSDAQYMALGRVTIAAAELEATVCMLLVLATENDRDSDELLLRPNSVWRRELQDLASSGKMPDGPLVEEWLDRCHAAFNERHEIVHSRWGMTPGVNGPKFPVGLHPAKDRTKDEMRSVLVPADEGYWNELADILEALKQEAGPFIGAAAVRCGLLRSGTDLVNPAEH